MKKLLYLLSLATVFVACNKDDNGSDSDPDAKEYITIAEKTDGNYTVGIYADDSLFEGYNQLYVQILNADNTPAETNIAIKPVMDMGMKKHSAPFEVSGVRLDDGKYPFNVVFIMPTTTGTKWMIEVDAKVGEDSVNVVLDLPEVKMPKEAKKVMYTTTTDSQKVFVSLVQPMEPEVGLNNFEITVHSKQSMWDFPAEDSFEFVVDPQMPDMDHGSPNNENPVHSVNGHYTGKVNFTMTGWWRVYLYAKPKAGAVTDTLYFDITF